MPDRVAPVSVEIFGQTYTIRAGSDPAYIERLAAQVDAEMLTISRGSGAVDSVRVAVLAALNLADEAEKAKERAAAAEALVASAERRAREAEESVASRANVVARRLAEALGEIP
jgi:cell division protein ZapA